MFENVVMVRPVQSYSHDTNETHDVFLGWEVVIKMGHDKFVSEQRYMGFDPAQEVAKNYADKLGFVLCELTPR